MTPVMNIIKKSYYLFFILLISSVCIRLFLFYTYWGDLRHGSADNYGSAAIGLFYGEGLTLNKLEQKKISSVTANYTRNFLSFHEVENRKIFTAFLPGPSILLYSLWKVLPIYNFSSYIWFQILLESTLIALFYLVFSRKNETIILITTVLMAINPITIRYTLSMGYDFWPHFCVLINFIGVALVLKNNYNKKKLLIITGILTGLTFWFRSITNFLPFYMIIFLLIYWRLKNKQNFRKIILNIALYFFPIAISLFFLMSYRYELTGNYRPTRSTFWHSFWAGVGQFSNPYNLINNDLAIWEFGKKINRQLDGHGLDEGYETPDSLYEKTLEAEAINFIKRYPHVFIRNIFYRISIMIAPAMYKGGKFIPKYMEIYLFTIGFLLIALWIFGMYNLYIHQKEIFWLASTIYLYFFSTIGTFYLVGRAIAPLLFINIFVYLFGIKSITRIIRGSGKDKIF
jgi:hypothetical protein